MEKEKEEINKSEKKEDQQCIATPKELQSKTGKIK